MISNRKRNRTAVLGFVAAGFCVVALTTGCSEKKEAQKPPTGVTPGGTPERRVTTGADPDKAPAYPGMYGAPSGSK